jgi:prophage regulatory protein
MTINEERLLRLRTVVQRVGLSKSEIYRRIGEGRFPRQHRYLGSRLVFWRGSEVAIWIATSVETAL